MEKKTNAPRIRGRRSGTSSKTANMSEEQLKKELFAINLKMSWRQQCLEALIELEQAKEGENNLLLLKQQLLEKFGEDNQLYVYMNGEFPELLTLS